MNCTTSNIPRVCLMCGSKGCSHCNYNGIPTKPIPLTKGMVIIFPSVEILSKIGKDVVEKYRSLSTKSYMLTTDVVSCEVEIIEM